MEAVATVVDRINCAAKSGHDFLRRRTDQRRNPDLAHGLSPTELHYSHEIEILKRLQREVFSDLMKLRDRQDKVERMLSFYKSPQGNPFQGSCTWLRGEVDAVGALLLMGDVDQNHHDAVGRAGIDPGINARFTFETTIRERDALVAELVASQKGTQHDGDISRTALSLAKVLYVANFSDCISAALSPLGAQFKDLGSPTYSYHQTRGLTDISAGGPPLLNEQVGTAVGITVRKSNIVASVGQAVSGLGTPLCDGGIGHALSSFGQIAYKLPAGLELSILGTHQVPKASGHMRFGYLAIPVGFLRHDASSTSLVEPSATPVETSNRRAFSGGSIALKLESPLDLDTRIAAWIQMKTSHPKNLQWAINVFDDSEDENGWGLNVSGTVEGSRSSRLQAESYIKLNLAKKFRMKPGIVYAIDGNRRMLSLMVRSNWSF